MSRNEGGRNEDGAHSSHQSQPDRPRCGMLLSREGYDVTVLEGGPEYARNLPRASEIAGQKPVGG